MGWFRRRDRQLDGQDEGSGRSGVRPEDRQLLDQLRRAGADLAEPRHVIHFLYAPTESDAQEIVQAAATNGFHGEVREPLAEYPDQWSVICQTTAVLTNDFVRSSTEFFEALAERFGAEYDGWEAAV